MKKAFTLIELLVVIAIIAILAAILFPVFAQAKLAAKKTAGLSSAKQIGTGLQLYIGDSDDVIPPYRYSTPDNAPINPTYLAFKAAGDPRAATMEAQGSRAISCVFFNQMLQPYIKNDQIWKNSENPNAWVNFQDKGTPDPNFHSYGGQNSYAVSNYLVGSNAKVINATAIAEPSNTLYLVDATYYNVLPAQPLDGFCQLNGYSNTGDYLHYWKQLGNGIYKFGSQGDQDPNSVANAAQIKQMESRYGGVVNVARTDSSAKAFNVKALALDLRSKGQQSLWNPLKTQCENGVIIPQ
ncbi:prepilin-type N-terminal cleavage/methylation domain-containing protein [bacterium]|nr:MAG: prepilin-type N-terminal cleavage/methylation domain-containing protein [bacterium]